MLTSAGRHVTVQSQCDHALCGVAAAGLPSRVAGRKAGYFCNFWSGACLGYGVVQGRRGGAASGRAVFPDLDRLGKGVRPASVSMTAFGIVSSSVVVRER